MGRHYNIAVIAIVAFTTYVSGQENAALCFQEDQNTIQSGQLGVENFGWKLFRDLAGNTAKSKLISTYSIWSAFLLAYFGSGGRTQQQLGQALGIEGKTSTFQRFKQLQFLVENPFLKDGAEVKTLNRAYFDHLLPLKKCISNLIKNTEHINFQNVENAAEIINQATSSATNGKITKLVEPQTLLGATFVLLNAVHFQGIWEVPFINKVNFDSDTEFKDESGNVIGQVDMMISLPKGGLIAQAPDLGAEILELPYANSSFSMFLILPDGDTSGVDTVLGKLTSENFQESLNNTVKTQSIIGVPKFKMETTLSNDLKQAMGRLGVWDLFSANGDLSSFSNVPLRADFVVHKAVVEVTREATGFIETQIAGKNKIMIFDRPFIFLIHDKRTRVTLFSGTFRHPDDATPV